MDLSEIGAALREGRERKGLTIQEVEVETKISPAVITALETGDSSKFPHPVYARGFVRSYAMLLGLDATELCAHFSRAYPVILDGETLEVRSPVAKARKGPASGRTLRLVWILIFGILLLALVGWLAFRSYLPEQAAVATEEALPSAPESSAPELSVPESSAPELSVPESPVPDPSVSEPPVEGPLPDHSAVSGVATEQNATASVQDAESVSVSTAISPVANAGVEMEANTTTVQTPEVPVVEAAPVANDTALSASPLASLPEVVSEEVVEPSLTAAEVSPKVQSVDQNRVLRVVAHASCWLRARVDDKVEEYFLKKGDAVDLTFRQALHVKFGNVGGVNLTLDGRPYSLGGASGEVKSLDLK